MPHPATRLSSIIPKVDYQANRFLGAEGCLLEAQVKSYLNQVGGGYLYQGRCASQRAEKDAFGWRPPTPYWGYKFATSDSQSIGNPSWTAPYVGSWWTTDSMNCPVVASKSLPAGINLPWYQPSFEDLQARAITDALAELGSATAELGVELKEARKTASFVADKLSLLVTSVKAVRRGKIPPAWRKQWRRWKQGPLEALTPAGTLWMEYRYAWSPMILGIYDALDLLDKRAERPQIVTVRKREDDSVVSVTSLTQANHGAYYPIKADRVTETEETKSVYVVLSFTPKSYLYKAVNDAGVLNPASVVWETIPLSWMADWFVNVGDYANAQAAMRLWNLKGGTATHRHEWWTSVSVSDFNPPFPTATWCYIPVPAASAKAGGFAFNRVVLSQDDMTASLAFRPNLGWERVLDLSSVLHGLLTGMFKRNKGLRI